MGLWGGHVRPCWLHMWGLGPGTSPRAQGAPQVFSGQKGGYCEASLEETFWVRTAMEVWGIQGQVLEASKA